MRKKSRSRPRQLLFESLEDRRLLANELLTWGAGLIVGDFGGSRGGIFVSRPDGSDMRQITTSQTNNFEFSGHGLNLPDDHPSFSPDGTRIVFTTSRYQASGETNNFEIAIMNVDGTNIRRLTNSPGIDTEPVFSPDGGKIAFASSRAGNLDIWVMNADGTNPVRLTTAPEGENEPSWSHTGTRIAYTKILDGGVLGVFDAEKDIYVIDANGANQRLVAGLEAEEHDAVWSLDDTKLIITSEKDGTRPFGDVCTIDIATRAYVNNLTIDDRFLSIGGGGDPTLSPDGTKIAYFKATGGPLLLAGPQAVFVMNADGTGKTKINAPGIINVHPHLGRIADSDLDGIPDYMDAQSPASFTEAMIQDEARVRNFLGDLTKLETHVGIGRLLAKGYFPSHNFNSFSGMGVAFARDINNNDPSILGRPDVLLYSPDLTPGLVFTPSPTDAFADFPYRLIGWGYATGYDPAEIPRFGAFPADAWLVHEAGFHHLIGGTFEPTPPSGDVPKGSKPMNVRPSGNIGTPWHERLWDLHFFTNPNGGAPVAAIHDPFGRNLPGFSSGIDSFFYPQLPFNGNAISGQLVEAEDFDMAENFGWRDNTAGNLGGKYRVTEVDIAESLDDPTGFDVVAMQAGEFLRYTVDLPTTGTYEIAFRMTNGQSGGRFHVEVDGVNRSGPVSIPLTVSSVGRLRPNRYESFVPFATSLTAGKHVVKIVFEASPTGTGPAPRFNSFSITRATPLTATMAAVRKVTTTADSTLIHVTYADNAAINVATIDGADIRVTGPDGFNQPATLVGTTEPGDSPVITATYKLLAPVTVWDPDDNGRYTVVLQAGQVSDVRGNSLTGRALGTFDVDVPRFALVQVVDFPQPTLTLVVNGTERSDQITVSRLGGELQVFLGGTLIGRAVESTLSGIVVNAAGGNDVVNLSAARTPSTINGGDGNDTMTGGAAADTIHGGGGADVAIDPHIGTDTVDLGPETSLAQGVRFHGTERDDRIIVERQVIDDEVWMIFVTNFGTFSFPVDGCRTVFIEGGRGNDYIAIGDSAASSWHAKFLGGRGDDTLIGGTLSDALRGQAGADLIVGRGGRDLLAGGPGRDKVVFPRGLANRRGRAGLLSWRRSRHRPVNDVGLGLRPVGPAWRFLLGASGIRPLPGERR